MSEYNLPDEGKKEMQEFLDKFKQKMLKTAEETISSLYCDISHHIETDHWTNFREHYRIEVQNNFKYSKCKECSEQARIFRRTLVQENKDELIPLLNQDLAKRVHELEDRVKEFEMFKYR